MLMLLCDVVEVDVGDGVVMTVCQVEEEVFRAIKVDPRFSLRVVSGQLVGLKHLRLQLFLFEKQLLYHLLADINSIGDLRFFRSLLVQLLLDLRHLQSLHDHDLHLLYRVNLYITESKLDQIFPCWTIIKLFRK